MPRRLAAAAALASLVSCLDFQGQIDACKDSTGAWVCPRSPVDAGVDGGGGGAGGGAGGGGGGTGGGSASGACPGLEYPVRTPGVSGSWCWMNPLPGGVSLNDIVGTSSSDLWAVGEFETVLHWDGGTWTRVPGPPYTGSLDAIQAALLLPGGALVVGGAGIGGVHRRNPDGTWTRDSSDPDVVRQLALREDGGWLAASESGVYSAGGLLLQTGGEFFGVLSTGPGRYDFLASDKQAWPDGGYSRRLLLGDGGVDHLEDLPPSFGGQVGYAFRRLWVDSAGRQVVAAAATPLTYPELGSSVLRRDAGQGWATVFNGLSGSLLYAGTSVASPAGGSFAVGTNRQAVFVSGPGASIAASLPGVENVDLAGCWSASDGTAWAVGAFGYLASGPANNPASSSWTRRTQGTLETLLGAVVLDGGILAVGNSDARAGFPGTLTPPPTGSSNENWRGVWAAPDGTLVLAGNGGTVRMLRPGGSAWSLHSQFRPDGGGYTFMNDVWGTSLDDVLVTAESGLYAASLDGGAPALLAPGYFWKVHGDLVSGAAWAGTEDGRILSRANRDAGWVEQFDGGGSTDVLYALTVEAVDSVFAAGGGNRALHWDGATWSPLPNPPFTVFDLAVTPSRLYASGQTVNAALTGAAYLPRGGSDWVSLTPPAHEKLERIRVVGGKVWVFGTGGAVLRLDEPP